MDIRQLLRADYLDILFDGRNKNYGGYELRRAYSRRARNAVLAALSGVSIMVTAPVVASHFRPADRPPITFTGGVVLTPPPVLPERPKPLPMPVTPPPSAPAQSIRNTVMVVVPNDVATDPPPPNADLHDKQIALTTNTTGVTGESTDIIPDHSGPSGQTVVEMQQDNQVHKGVVDILPRFNGDLDGFLKSHLRYPDGSRERGEQGRTIVQFVVNTDGSVQDIKVVRSAGAELDAEALRVVHVMPAWKPGVLGGKPVRVQYALPIDFQLD